MPRDPDGSLPDLAVDPVKITAYLLNIDRPEGGAKARFFIARGFGLDGAGLFVEALLAHAVPGHLIR